MGFVYKLVKLIDNQFKADVNTASDVIKRAEST